ncbi:MAG: hypothetical protein HYR56_00345 [Acidobacteria bacterium]|nr:hypothetical protein [Acidobacteriota bacterium]MBI3422360.1 hypothetical protein [Acidobacteriota bacterium]
MHKARLIKLGAQSNQRTKQAQSAQRVQAASLRTAVKTARAWVKEHQTAARLTPQQQFAALFSGRIGGHQDAADNRANSIP